MTFAKRVITEMPLAPHISSANQEYADNLLLEKISATTLAEIKHSVQIWGTYCF